METEAPPKATPSEQDLEMAGDEPDPDDFVPPTAEQIAALGGKKKRRGGRRHKKKSGGTTAAVMETEDTEMEGT